jgi:hypothetical protein
MSRKVILISLISISNPVRPQNTHKYASFEKEVLICLQVEQEDTDETLSIGTENDAIAVAAEWSPLGLSRSYDCVLAVLDSHHQVSIWESTGVGTSDNWIPVHVPRNGDAYGRLRILLMSCLRNGYCMIVLRLKILCLEKNR